MEGSGSGEVITPGPQKERETRITTVALTKSQDHLDSQVSLDDDTNHDHTITVPLLLANENILCLYGKP